MASSHLVSSLLLLTLASSCQLFLLPHPSNANSLTEASGLPFLNPYLKEDADFRHGVNFAVAGATALPTTVPNMTDNSLKVQLNWMSKHFNSTCITKSDCLEKQKTSLFMLGEIGGNDYNDALAEGKTIQDITEVIVPEVVAAIISAVRRVIISFGAVRVVVPGIFPNGCFPIFLTLFQTKNSSAYDKHGCLKEFNSLANYHDKKLQEAIQEVKREYPDVIIVYGDYYRAFQWVFDHAVELGFDGESKEKACCGIGGDYNYNLTMPCSSEVPVCPNPKQFISWDGVHLTDEGFKRMAEWLINDMLPKLQCCV